MHEMSIAMGIVDIANKEAIKAKVDSFSRINLEIGTLSGIELQSLDFIWQAAVKDSVLENAEKHIKIIRAKARCNDCDTLYNPENIYDNCPNCGSFLKIILQGKELRVKSLELA